MHRLLYLVRHGETDWNACGRWQGHTDVGLNSRGRAQALRAAEAMRGVAIAGIVSSDLARARETALIVAEALSLPLLYVDVALRERSFGCFEGLTREECEQQYPEAWGRWLAERRPPPGGEDQATLAKRVTTALVHVAQHVACDGTAALVVSHAAAIRAFVATVTGILPPPVANGEVWRASWDGRAFVVHGRWNPPAIDEAHHAATPAVREGDSTGSSQGMEPARSRSDS